LLAFASFGDAGSMSGLPESGHASMPFSKSNGSQDSGDVELLEPAEAVKLSRLKSNLGADDPLFIGALEDTTAD
jgi:hypothetical protein